MQVDELTKAQSDQVAKMQFSERGAAGGWTLLPERWLCLLDLAASEVMVHDVSCWRLTLTSSWRYVMDWCCFIDADAPYMMLSVTLAGTWRGGSCYPTFGTMGKASPVQWVDAAAQTAVFGTGAFSGAHVVKFHICWCTVRRLNKASRAKEKVNHWSRGQCLR